MALLPSDQGTAARTRLRVQATRSELHATKRRTNWPSSRRERPETAGDPDRGKATEPRGGRALPMMQIPRLGPAARPIVPSRRPRLVEAVSAEADRQVRRQQGDLAGMATPPARDLLPGYRHPPLAAPESRRPDGCTPRVDAGTRRTAVRTRGAPPLRAIPAPELPAQAAETERNAAQQRKRRAGRGERESGRTDRTAGRSELSAADRSRSLARMAAVDGTLQKGGCRRSAFNQS